MQRIKYVGAVDKKEKNECEWHGIHVSYVEQSCLWERYILIHVRIYILSRWYKKSLLHYFFVSRLQKDFVYDSN